MELNALSTVADLTAQQRQAVESLVGHSLDGKDTVFLVVLRTGQSPTPQSKASSRARLANVFEQVDRHGDRHSIAPDEADSTIDAAIDDVRSRSD